jgi:hypothetical protein
MFKGKISKSKGYSSEDGQYEMYSGLVYLKA